MKSELYFLQPPVWSIQSAMTDVMANVLVDVHPSKAKLTFFLDRICFLIAFTVSEYSLRQMLLSVLADGSTTSLRNAFDDHCSLRIDIAFLGIWAETNPNIGEAIPGVLLKFRRYEVFCCQFGALSLSIVWILVKSNCQIWISSANIVL